MQSVQFLKTRLYISVKKSSRISYFVFPEILKSELDNLSVFLNHSHTYKLHVLTHCFLKLVSYNDNMKTNIYIHKSAKTIQDDEPLEFHISYTSHQMANVAVCQICHIKFKNVYLYITMYINNHIICILRYSLYQSCLIDDSIHFQKDKNLQHVVRGLHGELCEMIVD